MSADYKAGHAKGVAACRKFAVDMDLALKAKSDEIARLKIENTVLLEAQVKDGEEMERLRGKLVANGWAHKMPNGSFDLTSIRHLEHLPLTTKASPSGYQWVRVAITTPEESK